MMEQGRGDELRVVWGRYEGEGIWRMGGKGWKIDQRGGIGWGTGRFDARDIVYAADSVCLFS